MLLNSSSKSNMNAILCYEGPEHTQDWNFPSIFCFYLGKVSIPSSMCVFRSPRESCKYWEQRSRGKKLRNKIRTDKQTGSDGRGGGANAHQQLRAIIITASSDNIITDNQVANQRQFANYHYNLDVGWQHSCVCAAA